MSELRASFPERDAYLDRLAQHYADGLLDDAGFEQRRDLLLQATSHGEMLRAFDGLPKPRYREGDVRQRRGVGRRGLLIGGIAAVGAVAAAAAGGIFARPYEYVSPAEPWMEATPSPIEYTSEPFPIPFDYGAMDEVYMQLSERGLTLASEYVVNADGVQGVVMSPRAQGEMRPFSQLTGRPLVVAEAVSGDVPPTVELDTLHNILFQAADQGVGYLSDYEGVVDSMQLTFTERGTPTVVVQVIRPDGTPRGTAQFDMDGNLMSLEENQ